MDPVQRQDLITAEAAALHAPWCQLWTTLPPHFFCVLYHKWGCSLNDDLIPSNQSRCQCVYNSRGAASSANVAARVCTLRAASHDPVQAYIIVPHGLAVLGKEQCKATGAYRMGKSQVQVNMRAH